MADVNTRKDAIALLTAMAQNALGAFGAAKTDAEEASAALHYKALDMAIADMKHLENDPGPFVRPDNLTDKEFLIVERNCVEVYSKDRFLPMPVSATAQNDENQGIVHCKDCMFRVHSTDKTRTYCGMHSSMPNPFEVFENDFCSRGERKGGKP